ncbi:MAG: zinc-binding dehydrogenase, partial [Candidatus Saccharimonadales bacterium]
VTVAPEDIGYVKSLGADEIIDYTKQDFTDIIRDYDAVFDTVGGEVLLLSLPVLRHGAKAVSMIASVDDKRANEAGVSVTTQSTKVLTDRLSELAELADEGIIKVRIGRTFPLENIQEAFAAREAGTRGKVVVAIS